MQAHRATGLALALTEQAGSGSAHATNECATRLHGRKTMLMRRFTLALKVILSSVLLAACGGGGSGGGNGQAPTATLTAPANFADNLAGTITLSATATDDVGVASVEFQVDGKQVAFDFKRSALPGQSEHRELRSGPACDSGAGARRRRQHFGLGQRHGALRWFGRLAGKGSPRTRRGPTGLDLGDGDGTGARWAHLRRRAGWSLAGRQEQCPLDHAVPATWSSIRPANAA